MTSLHDHLFEVDYAGFELRSIERDIQKRIELASQEAKPFLKILMEIHLRSTIRAVFDPSDNTIAISYEWSEVDEALKIECEEVIKQIYKTHLGDTWSYETSAISKPHSLLSDSMGRLWGSVGLRKSEGIKQGESSRTLPELLGNPD